MARIAWTRDALTDLHLIRRYVEQFDPVAAEHIASRLDAAANALQDFPHRGRPSTNGRRELPTVAPYLIRYIVVDDLVLITEVTHSARERD